ncbi:putative cord and cs domain protein [Phaeomoniella chlamydospora]|uniref:Putative cord and cs domain protein n=1 Tax=Phaeomoniella chlamydospora TaxID=158046 RepID=A0A0G2EM85_PHACM|nr:putative cord and cs domain protein [Phaeomoniella chlamydospora]
MAAKCVHKGCGKVFSDPDEPCIYHPGPPDFHEGQKGAGATCKRKGCNATYDGKVPREDEECVHHPGAAVFHEGSKGWSCCKRRVLEFEEFMKIEGCTKKKRHLFLGKGKPTGEEKVETVRTDFYQTSTAVIASLYLKKIDSSKAKVDFSSPNSIDVDLPTADDKRYATTIPLFGPIDTEASKYKIMGTKLEFSLIKADGASWPVFRSDDRLTGERIQVGKAGRVS